KRQSLRAQRGRVVSDPGDISTWPRETRNQTDTFGVAGKSHDDRDGRTRLLGSCGRRRAERDDQIHFETDELRGQRRQLLAPGFGPAARIDDVLPFAVSEFLERLPQRSRRSAVRGASPCRKISDSVRLSCLLRVGDR